MSEEWTVSKIFLSALAILILGFARDIQKLISGYWKKMIKKFRSKEKKQADDLLLSVKIGQEVNAVLLNMRAFFRADRICVFEYHNSGVFNNGLSFIKATNTYEICEDGICSLNFTLKDLPVQSFSEFNESIISHRLINCKDTTDKSNNDAGIMRSIAQLRAKTAKIDADVCYILKVIEHTKSFYAYGLYNERKKAVGFVTMEYCSEFCSLSPEDLEEFTNYCNRISVMLDLKK